MSAPNTTPGPCAFPGCSHGADPRWGGYCDGHGVTTERELENRHSAIVAIATEAVELRTQVAALRAQRRVLREALDQIRATWTGTPYARWSTEMHAVDIALDATKEEP